MSTVIIAYDSSGWIRNIHIHVQLSEKKQVLIKTASHSTGYNDYVVLAAIFPQTVDSREKKPQLT